MSEHFELLQKSNFSPDSKLVTVCLFDLRDSLNKLIFISSEFDKKFKDLDERLNIVEDCLEEMYHHENVDIDECPKISNELKIDEIQINNLNLNTDHESDDESSVVDTRLSWQRINEHSANEVAGCPPMPGVKYTDLEHNAFISNGYDKRLGIYWSKWESNDGSHWWELMKSLNFTT